MNNYIYFKKGNLKFIDSNNKKCIAPSFVNKGAKNYRFDLTSNILEKMCIECDTYLAVQKLENTKFYSIHDEEEIHFISDISGYQGRCNSYLTKQHDNNDTLNTIPSNPYTISSDNRKYIFHLALIQETSEEEALNYIISLIRKHNPISYTEKIK